MVVHEDDQHNDGGAHEGSKDGLTKNQYHRLREFLLSTNRPAKVFRELWTCNGATYPVYRKQLSSLKASFSKLDQGLLLRRANAAVLAALPATAKYSFEGMKHVLDDSRVQVTVVAFAPVRNDLLAFANAEGRLFLVSLSHESPKVMQAQHVHRRPVTALDWSFDNSQLLTCGSDGAVCMWDAATGDCMRSILATKVMHHCCRLYPLNSNIAFVGSSDGTLQVYNCSAGTLIHKVTMPRRAAVTAVEVTNQHAFVGDSNGMVHMCRLDGTSAAAGAQLARLTWTHRLRVAQVWGTPLTGLTYVPFCRGTDSPAVVATCGNGTLGILKVTERNALEAFSPPRPIMVATASSGTHTAAGGAAHGHGHGHTAHTAHPPGALLRPAVCPLSVIQDLPLVAVGCEDTNVYVVDVNPRLERPATITRLQGHRSAVVCVAWTFDEGLLASADTDGTVIVWKRTNLF